MSVGWRERKRCPTVARHNGAEMGRARPRRAFVYGGAPRAPADVVKLHRFHHPLFPATKPTQGTRFPNPRTPVHPYFRLPPQSFFFGRSCVSWYRACVHCTTVFVLTRFAFAGVFPSPVSVHHKLWWSLSVSFGLSRSFLVFFGLFRFLSVSVGLYPSLSVSAGCPPLSVSVRLCPSLSVSIHQHLSETQTPGLLRPRRILTAQSCGSWRSLCCKLEVCPPRARTSTPHCDRQTSKVPIQPKINTRLLPAR